MTTETETTCTSVVSRIAHEACVSAPRSGLPDPWWESLDEDFHDVPEDFELALRDKALVRACATFDTGVRTAGAVIVSGLAAPSGYRPSRLRRDMDDEEIYFLAAENRDPGVFFKPPPRDVEVVQRKPGGLVHFNPDDGVCEELWFESPYATINGRQARSYGRHRKNKIAVARFWRHKRGPRPTIIAIHGFHADGYWFNERLFEIKLMYGLGCDMLLVTLPFHGARQDRLSPFSGYGIFAGGVGQLNEAFGQAVCDIRVFMNYLEDRRGVEKIGVSGISLGGYTSALLATLEPRLKFSLPNVPVTSLPDLLLEWNPLKHVVRMLMRMSGLSLVDARRLVAVHCPLTYEPILPRERLMIIGGVGDRLAPPKHTRLLWEHWQRPRLHWFPGSHLVHLDKGDYIFEIERFLRDIEYLT